VCRTPATKEQAGRLLHQPVRSALRQGAGHERRAGPDQVNPSGAACATPSAHGIRGVAVDADLIALALASLAAIGALIVLTIASLRNPPRA